MLRAGAGIANLDWPLEHYPAQTQFALCEGKYDDCNCRALALKEGERRLLLMAYDLSDIPEVEDLEGKIAEAVGFDRSDVVITVTHNHTSPCDRGSRRVSEEEREAFRKGFLEIELEASLKAAREAVASMRPARFGYGEINSYINLNEITRNPRIGYYCDENTNGYSDKTLAVVKVVDAEEKPIAVLLNHCTHATFSMGTGLTSGNFPGLTSRFLEDYYGGGMVALWTSGAAGNQHPMLTEFVKPYTDGYVGRLRLPKEAELMLMEHAGRQHAIDAINCIDRITEYQDTASLQHVRTTVKIENQKNLSSGQGGPMPGRPMDYGMGVRSNQPVPAAPKAEPQIVDDPEHPTWLQMELFTLGNIALVGLGCELFCQIGRDIKAAIPAEHTVVITHTPGYVGDNPHAVGYIVDKSSLGSGHMKLYRNLKPGFYDDLIVNTAKGLYEEATK